MNFKKNKSLSSESENKQILVFDIFGKKHKRYLKNFRFRPSIYGVLNKDGKVLVQRHSLLSKFGFPGGGIKINESISHGLEREFKDETGIKIRIGKLLGVTEDYFTFKGVDVHGILIFYEVKILSGKLLTGGNNRDIGEVKFTGIESLVKKTSSRSQWPFIKEYKLSFKH